MRATKRGQHPRPDTLRAGDLASLKRLRAAATQAAQPVVSPTPAPIPKRKRMQRPATVPLAVVTSPTELTNTEDLKTTQLAPADINLFRQAMKTVTPIKDSNRAITPPAPVAAMGMLTQRRLHASGSSAVPPVQVSDHFVAAHVDQDDRSFVRSRDSVDLIKGLKRGKWPVQASLDLHGSTLDQARVRLDGFLQSCLDHEIRCVRVVHGKGYGSRNGTPVLKDVVRRWLTQLAAVQAYTECAECDGGAGAVQVLLTVPAA